MATRRVESFRKALSIDKGLNQYGIVIIKFERVSKERRHEFEGSENIPKFNALVHMLEHDMVYYDTTKRIYFSKKEFKRPSAPEPMT